MQYHKILVEATQSILDPATARVLVPKGVRFDIYGSLDCLTGDYGGVLFPVELHEIRLVRGRQSDDDNEYLRTSNAEYDYGVR